MRDDDRMNDRYILVEQPSDSGAGIGTFLLGLALGAGAALLLAPRSGEETRRMIGDRARDAGTKARQAIDDMTATVQDQFGAMRERVEETVGGATSAVRRRRRQVEHAFDAGRSAAHEARRELERKMAQYRAEDASLDAGTARPDLDGDESP